MYKHPYRSSPRHCKAWKSAFAFPLLLLISLSADVQHNEAIAAVPPELVQAIAEAAPEVLDKASSDASNAWKFLQRQRDKRKREKWSWISDIDIRPVAGNKGEITYFYYCGFRSKLAKHMRYAIEHRVSINGKRVLVKKLPGSAQNRSDAVSLTVNDFVPMDKVRNAIANGQEATTLAVRIETVCNTTKIKKNHTDTADFSTHVNLSFAKAIKETVDSLRKEKSPQRSNSGNLPQKTKGESKTQKNTAKGGSNAVALPPVSLQVKQTSKLAKPMKCPGRVHFTGRVKFNYPGEYTYFFDSNDGRYKTAAKSVKTNSSGTKDFYWNRPISAPAQSQQGVVTGWVRLNIHSRTQRGQGFYQSDKVAFTVNCKPTGQSKSGPGFTLLQ